MASVTDPNMNDDFTKVLEQLHGVKLAMYGEIIDTATELCQNHRSYVKSALDTGLAKCRDDEVMFDTKASYKNDSQHKSVLLSNKHKAVADVASEIQHKEAQKETVIQEIEKLRENQDKKKEMILSQTKANKKRLKNLQKSRTVFEKHLRLEVRTIHGKAQTIGGAKLQFVYRNINPAKLDSAYVITMGLKADGTYQIVSSDPHLEGLEDLEKRLVETNNLALFLADVRKGFISAATQEKKV